MAMTYKTVTGQITRPGSNVGIRAKVTATPMTTAAMLKFVDDDRITVGPETAETSSSGALSTLKVPTNVDLAELYWRITAEALDKVPGVPEKWTIKNAVQITGTGTVKLKDLVEIDVTAVNAQVIGNLTDLVGDAEAAAITATTKATETEGWAEAAASSAADADLASDTATGAAASASSSAGTASTAASTATDAASTATTKAGEASSSATAASNSATAAQTAKTAAETANTAAQAARTAAETARDQAVDISNIDTTDDAIDAALQIPGGKAASTLSASIAEQIAADVPAIVATEVAEVAAPKVVAPVVARPSAWNFSTLIVPTVYRLGGGRFLADMDWAVALRPTGGVTYYVDPAGADTNTGLTAASPITIPGALAKPDVGTIVYAPGEYFRNTHTIAATVTGKSINHIASGPGVKVTQWNNPGSTTWTLTSGSIYQTSRSGTFGVVDVSNRTSWGDYTTYVLKPDLASITGPGQCAVVGSTVYVWAIGNTDLTVPANRYQIRLGINGVLTGLPVSGGTHYARGIAFEGNQISAVGGALVMVEDCSVRYSLVDGVYVNASRFIGTRVEATSTGSDGFSYTESQFIEVDCTAHHNGHTATTYTNNATTSHGTSRGLRLNGDYDVAGGPTVADVNSARTWNLGCHAGDTTAVATQDHSWRADAVGFEGDPAQIFLDECTASGATNAFKVTGGAKIHLHATRYTNQNASDTGGSGTIDYYEAG